ncbi:MAG TPA: glutaredoxin 3 [Kofleriaceae bacterium]|jgi:glutaredoxin 3
MSAEVKIYTREWCGYCTSAISLLKKKGVAFEQIHTDGKPDLRQWLVSETGQRTVPQIFIDGKSIGGYSDMSALDDDGELDKLLSRQDARSEA